ncbi:MAG: hypothetical protein HY875_06920 [Chloroflexi bacterium]|nr:hypothetical protein [Chloroflexota bacterium]
MDAEITLGPDGERALREAERFCWEANVAILAAEHLLAGALLVLHRGGDAALPGEAALKAALLATLGRGDETLTDNVMWGSAARQALNTTARLLAESGKTVIGAREVAAGVIASGEAGPMFFSALGTTKADLLVALD